MKTIALHGSFSQNMVDCLQKKCPAGEDIGRDLHLSDRLSERITGVFTCP